MLAEILHKVAGQFQDEPSEYYPRPSLAGPDRCIRQMVYWGLKMPGEKFSGRTLHVFNDGNFHEELTADWIRKSAFKLHSQQMKVDCGTRHGIHLVGHVDGVVTDIMQHDYLLEHKSINHFTWQRYAEGELPLDYIAQTILYLHGLQQINPELWEAILLLKNKNTSQFLEFILALDIETGSAMINRRTDSNGKTVEMSEVIVNMLDDIFNKFSDIVDYIEEKKLPLRPYDHDNWHCQYCAYEKQCWEGYEEEFKSLADNADMDSEVETLCRYYLETSMHAKEMTDEKDALRKQIVDTLKAKSVRKGRAGDYMVSLALRESTRLDRELIPPNVLEMAEKKSVSEVLTIRKAKGGKDE